MKYLVIWICVLSQTVVLMAQSNDLNGLFNTGSEAYKSEDFNGAIEIFSELVEKGYYTAELYTNLGTAYLRTGQIGLAVLHLEKALLIDHKNAVAQQNLLLAKEQISNPISHIPDFIILSIWRKLVSSLSVMSWVILHGIFLLISILTLVGLWTTIRIPIIDGITSQGLGYWLLLIFLLFSILTLWIAIQRSDQITQINYGIVMNSGITLHSGPDERSAEVVTIDEGNRAKYLDQLDDWYKVQLDDKDEGWIKASTVQWIRIPE